MTNEFKEFLEEVNKEVTPEKVAWMCEVTEKMPPSLLKDSMEFSIKMLGISWKNMLKNKDKKEGV